MSYAKNEHIHAAQITNTLRHSRSYLVSLLTICLYIFSIYQLFFPPHAFYFNVWFVITEIFLSLCLLIGNLYFYTHDLTLKRGHIWNQIQYFSIGSLIAIGTNLIYFYLLHINPEFNHFDALTLSTLLFIVSQVFSLTYLTQKLHYFCLAFLPAATPYLGLQFLLINTETNVLFILCINFVLIVILLCAKHLVKINLRLSQLYEKNDSLAQKNQQQILWADELCQKLRHEKNKSKEIELKLEINNQLFEQKINERTLDIMQMNTHLENQRENIVLAHDIAGLHPWDWNIKDRKIMLTNYDQKKTYRSSHDHHQQLEHIIHHDDLKHFKNTMKTHLRGQIERYEVTYRIQHHGVWHWVHDIGRVVSRDPVTNKPLHMVGIHRDIHHEKTVQERLKLVASVLEQASEGIFILDENLRYIEVNPFYQNMTGLSTEQILGKHLFDITTNHKLQQRTLHLNLITQLIENGEYDGEFSEKFNSGNEFPIWMRINAISDEEKRITHYIGIVSDLTERKQQEQRLSYLENYDTLTDLPNRFYYNYQLHQYLMSQQDSIKQLAVIRINIDRFRPLNEYLTNNGGDELLRQVAQRLRLANSEALFLAHLNGDDFAIVYEISHIRPSVQEHCDRIAKTFTKPFKIFSQEYVITLSMGVSLYPEHGHQLDYLNNCAEQALTQAKHLGGNTVQYYTIKQHDIVEQGSYLESDLRKAILNHELEIFYQPKVNFSNQSIYGFEALIRWNHPEKGMLAPHLFIPIAEQTTLISDIGRIVIQKTAKQIRHWHDMGLKDVCVSVNIVAQQLQRGQLLEDLDTALLSNNIKGEALELEITESSLVENSESVKNLLKAIKARQIKISLDDFGTGYSNLSYLTDFPIDILKIDRSFVSKIGDKKQEAIVSAMIAMGKAMGLTIVAEGIETTEQFNYLNDIGCDIAQGYLFSKPLPEVEATSYLRSKIKSPSYTFLI